MKDFMDKIENWAVELEANTFRDGKSEKLVKYICEFGEAAVPLLVARELSVDDADEPVRTEDYFITGEIAKQLTAVIGYGVTEPLTVELCDKALAELHMLDPEDIDLDLLINACACEIETGADVFVKATVHARVPIGDEDE
jgi:hypothetical protein